LFEKTLVAQERLTLKSGPSAGMIYNVAASEGCRVPRLLGCYEKTLEPIIETITAATLTLIIDIGCAAGYYAFGLARRLPNTFVWARDADKIAREKCMALAATNHVGGPVKVEAN
jgi:methylase of polypeptide subunit release factors